METPRVTADSETREERLEEALRALMQWRNMLNAKRAADFPGGQREKELVEGCVNGPLWDLALEALA